jgi:hypothetical protein
LKPIKLILLIILLATAITPVKSLSTDEIRSELESSFILVRMAEQQGGNVIQLVHNLNTAALLLDSGSEENVTQARVLISEVKAEIPSIVTTGNQNASNSITVAAISVAVLGILGILVYVYGSKFYWGLWLRTHGNWRVENNE